MSKQTDSVGQFEQLVLTAVLTLGDGAYGVTIHEKITELAGDRSVNMGSVYVTLDRLDDKGYVSSWQTDATPVRRGRPKRFYRLTGAGERALQESVATARRVFEAVGDSWRLGKRKPRGARS